jgi:2EXR family
MLKEHELLFPGFVKLPIEIRLLIWELSLPDAFVIHLANRVGRFIELYEPLRSARELSPLLHVCQDSRGVFKRHYLILCDISTFERKHLTYFDPKVDTLYLDVTWHFIYHPISNEWRSAASLSTVDDWTVRKPGGTKCTNSTVESPRVYNADLNHFPFLADKLVLGSIRHLAMDHRCWNGWCTFHRIENIINFFPNFPGLETFTFVFGEDVWGEDEECKYPLELSDLRADNLALPYMRKVELRESKAQELARQKQTELKLPKFNMKILEKAKSTSMSEESA